MRLELSTRTDLALRALEELDRVGIRVKRPDLAAAVGTTPDFLARVMAPLVRAGWVVSEVGRSGGYQSGADLTSISMLDVIAAVEGTPDDGRCVLRAGPCLSAETCALHEAWSKARRALMTELEQTPVGAKNMRGVRR